MKKISKRSSSKRTKKPQPNRTLSDPTSKVENFSIRTHWAEKSAWAFYLLGLLALHSAAAEYSPKFDQLANWWLALIDWPWRNFFSVLGITHYPELGVMMTCMIALMLATISALQLERRNMSPKELDLKIAESPSGSFLNHRNHL